MTQANALHALTAHAPLDQGARVESLDVLRGVALLGILVMNIQLFAMPQEAYFNPTVWGDLQGANFLVWLFSHLLADQKMMTLFSMLFGAGIVVFTERATANQRPATLLHLRRSFWLLVFGALHAYLLWYGDILLLYSLCAFAVVWFRHRAPRTLIVGGLLVLCIPSVFYGIAGWSLPYWPADDKAAFVAGSWQPPAEAIAAEVAAYQGGWMAQMAHRVPAALEMHTVVALVWGFWRAAGLMLIGMGLYKLGVFSARSAPSAYVGLVAAGLLIGLPLVGYGVYWNISGGWRPASFFIGGLFNYWGSLLVSLAWVGLVMSVCQRSLLARTRARLAAVGRTAFSNYILQTVICTSVFYGHGLGWFGEVSRVGQIAIVAAVWMVQLWLSPLWLRYFRFGPLEWLWRCLTYARWQPIGHIPLTNPPQPRASHDLPDPGD